MTELILHEQTRKEAEYFIRQPSHALLISGPAGIGKGMLARHIAATLLGVSLEQVDRQAYVRFIEPDLPRNISIAAVRTLEHFVSRRTPGSRYRIGLIEQAHTLTDEAQNALLKLLEEPPDGTILLFTTEQTSALLPTIRSRLPVLRMLRPPVAALSPMLAEISTREQTDRLLLMSGGLPGVLSALLAGDETHRLVRAASTARTLLQQTSFERLVQVDVLAKDRDVALDTLQMLQAMAHIALERGSTAHSARLGQWQRVLETSYRGIDLLVHNAQPKLVLTDVALNL